MRVSMSLLGDGVCAHCRTQTDAYGAGCYGELAFDHNEYDAEHSRDEGAAGEGQPSPKR